MYYLGNDVVDSIELKCFVVSRGAKVDKQVYQKYGKNTRLNPNPLMCNCMILSDETIVQLTDMSFHLKQLGSMLSWNNIKLMKYASQLGTPFTISLKDERAALMYNGEFVDFISFAPPTDFYKKKTSSGMPYIGNAVLQGLDWVAFQCLWPCEFGAAGKPCEFCFSGAEFETLAAKKKPLPKAVLPTDVAEIVKYAFDHVGCNSILKIHDTLCGMVVILDKMIQKMAYRQLCTCAMLGLLLLFLRKFVREFGKNELCTLAGKRLEQIVLHAVTHRGNRVFKGIVTAENDNFSSRAALANLCNQFQSVPSRHLDVCQEHIIMVALQQMQSFCRAPDVVGNAKTERLPVQHIA